MKWLFCSLFRLCFWGKTYPFLKRFRSIHCCIQHLHVLEFFIQFRFFPLFFFFFIIFSLSFFGCYPQWQTVYFIIGVQISLIKWMLHEMLGLNVFPCIVCVCLFHYGFFVAFCAVALYLKIVCKGWIWIRIKTIVLCFFSRSRVSFLNFQLFLIINDYNATKCFAF